jgi:hypothetical protein
VIEVESKRLKNKYLALENAILGINLPLIVVRFIKITTFAPGKSYTTSSL